MFLCCFLYVSLKSQEYYSNCAHLKLKIQDYFKFWQLSCEGKNSIILTEVRLSFLGVMLIQSSFCSLELSLDLSNEKEEYYQLEMGFFYDYCYSQEIIYHIYPLKILIYPPKLILYKFFQNFQCSTASLSDAIKNSQLIS